MFSIPTTEIAAPNYMHRKQCYRGRERGRKGGGGREREREGEGEGDGGRERGVVTRVVQKGE
eukprot:754441-Hanusia_phi.AAC.1